MEKLKKHTFRIDRKDRMITPLEKSQYITLTSYNDLINFLEGAAKDNSCLFLEYIAKSSEGRKIPAIRVSEDIQPDKQKLRILIFAQQHGNEHSGKEAVLHLLKEIVDNEFDYLFEKMDLLLVPQINPDGAEKNIRENEQGLDLNCDHLLLSSPEIYGLHNYFLNNLPEITLDVHEYSPYSKNWMEFGYIKNFDEQFGNLTNLNISKEIRDLVKDQFFPFIKEYSVSEGYTFHEYIIGGPPSKEEIRYSTVDINDGRQSFGILNTMSIILEGKNGRTSADRIHQRTLSQFNAIKGLLEFAYRKADVIKKSVDDARIKLINSSAGDKIILRMEHTTGDTPLDLHLVSVEKNVEKVITVEKYHSQVNPTLEIEKPKGYLIPSAEKQIIEFLTRNKIRFYPYERNLFDKYEKYSVIEVKTLTHEEAVNFYPVVEKSISKELSEDLYYFIPINQLASNLVSLALEPQSLVGLVQYYHFNYLLRFESNYPVIRVV